MLPKLVVVDGHAILFRSFFAIRELTSPDGEPTNAIFGFLRSINKVTERLEPQYIVVCFDSPGKTFREEDYAQYKAQREPAPEELKQQIQPVHELLEAMNIPVIEKEGFEADDLIGTIVAYCEENEIETIIVSRDKDLYQLLSDNVRMFDDKNEEFFTAQDLKEKFGLEPRQVPDWLGLMGDSSDNIPGVPKVGKKTARDLLQEYDNVEGILENIEKIREKRKAVGKSLEEHQDEARRSKKLAMLQAETGVDFDPQSFRRSEPDYTRLAKLYRKFGFNSMLKDIEDKLPSSKAETEWRVIDTADELESYVNRCLQMDEVAIDTETTGLSYFSDKLIGISLSAEEGKGVYIPCVEGYGDSLLSARPADGLPTAKIRELLSPLAESDKVIKVGHNLKFDMCFLRRSGIELKPPFGDSLVAAWLLTPEGSSLKLDDVARQYLGLSTVPITDLIGEGKNKASMDEVDLEELAHYAAEDADIALRLHRILVKKLREEDLYEPYSEIELPLLPVLAEMEYNGIALNTDRLERLGEKLQTELSELTSKIHEAAGEKFNINSPIQLAQILFDKLGLTVVKEGKSRPSTDASSLEAIKDEHEIVPLVLRYRLVKKLLSTYIEALPEYVSPDGRIHSSFNQTGTATGRLSSNRPNLQNIPARTDESRMIRSAFVPGEGKTFVSADYSQVELRVLAHFCGDEGLKKAFSEGRDIHSVVASEVFDVPLDEVDKEKRTTAKAVNFGLVYGQGVWGLSNFLDISRKKAKEFIDRYFERFPRVREFKEARIEKAREQGYVTTLGGRRRFIPQLSSSNPRDRAQGERLVINTLVQGSAADLIKVAMIKLNRRILREELPMDLILQIHDELLYEVPRDARESTAEVVKEEMESAMELDVPLEVTVGTGLDWLELK